MADELTPVATVPPDPSDLLATTDLLDGTAGELEEASVPALIGRTPVIDFVNRTWLPSTAGGPLMVEGLQALQQWCEKCLRTRRGESPACDPSFGVEALATDYLGGVLSAADAAAWEADVKRALEMHPLIEEVTGVRLEGAEDGEATLFFTLELRDETVPVDLQTDLGVSGG